MMIIIIIIIIIKTLSPSPRSATHSGRGVSARGALLVRANSPHASHPALNLPPASGKAGALPPGQAPPPPSRKAGKRPGPA